MEEIRTISWNGKIPVVLKLAPEEFLDSEINKVLPFYSLLPRISYLANFVEQISSHFQSNIQLHPSFPQQHREILDDINSAMTSLSRSNSSRQPAMINFEKIRQFVEANIWFSYKNQPLKWHYPIGVLFDFFGDPSSLPWNITVHLDNYPSDLLLAPPVSRTTMESIFMSCIKEADWLKHRGNVIEKMLPRDHRQLWFAFTQNNYETFWSINKKLMEMKELTNNVRNSQEPVEELKEIPDDPSSSQLRGFNHVPCRVYWHEANGTGDCETPRSIRVTQKLIKPFIYDEQLNENCPISVGQVFLKLAPKDLDLTLDKLIRDYRLLVHGIDCNVAEDIQESYELFSHPDNFLHLTARARWSLP